MRGVDAYPHDAVTGSCFITGDYAPGEIVDLEIYLDALPPYGRLCVSGKAVRDMVTALGWAWPSAEQDAQLDMLVEANAHLRDENQKMRKAVAAILSAAKLSGLQEWMVTT